MLINLLLVLLLDLLLVDLIKGQVCRRPAALMDMFVTISVDRYSFLPGLAARVTCKHTLSRVMVTLEIGTATPTNTVISFAFPSSPEHNYLFTC